MSTSHRSDGPGSSTLPGPRDLAAFYANDNRARFSASLAGACGVVLAAEPDPDGMTLVTIRLLIADGTLSDPLHATPDPGDVIALWRGFGRELNLPLYLRDGSGVMTPVTPLAGEFVYARRYGSALTGRRSRFLTRRQVPMTPFVSKKKAAGKARKGALHHSL